MNNQKQIEEMAKDLENHTCMSQFQAEIASRMLYIKGYRKASDILDEAYEILKELKDEYRLNEETREACAVRNAMFKLAELIDKYTESEDME